MKAKETQEEAQAAYAHATKVAREDFNNALAKVDQWNAQNPTKHYPQNPHSSPDNDQLQIAEKNRIFLEMSAASNADLAPNLP